MRALIALLLMFVVATSPSAREVPAKTAPSHAGAAANAAVVDIGKLDGADYRIDIPAQWNHGLIVFFHGYSIEPVAFRQGEALSPMFEPMLKSGYAVIQSAYSATGWAVEQASADTEKLRRKFVAKYGRPTESFMMGMSMGGALTAMTIETRAQTYDGALALCGAIEPTHRFMQRDFAFRAAFDYFFPGVFGALVPVPADYVPTEAVVRRVTEAMKANPRAATSLHAMYGGGDIAELPGVIAFITYDVKEMQQRLHANPFGNAALVYTGSGDDFELNDGVKRYEADSHAAAYLSRWYTPSGILTKPMLALHTVGDPLVVASTAFEYALIAQRSGHADKFVQQYTNGLGHCAFTPAQIGTAFNELVNWKRSGKRPQSGRQR